MNYKSIFMGLLIGLSILQTNHIEAIEWKETIGEVIYTSVHLARDYAPVIISASPFITAAVVKAYLWWKSVRIHAQAKANGADIKANTRRLDTLSQDMKKLETTDDAQKREQRLNQGIGQVKSDITDVAKKISNLETQEGAQQARAELKELLAKHGLELNKTNVSLEEMKKILIFLQKQGTVSPQALEQLKQELLQQMVSQSDLTTFKTEVLDALTEQTRIFLARFDDVVDQNDQGPSTGQIAISQQFGPGGGPASFGSSVGLNHLYLSTGSLITTLPSYGRGKPAIQN